MASILKDAVQAARVSVEEPLIRAALIDTRGDIRAAARALGVSHEHVRRKMRQHRIAAPRRNARRAGLPT